MVGGEHYEGEGMVVWQVGSILERRVWWLGRWRLYWRGGDGGRKCGGIIEGKGG